MCVTVFGIITELIPELPNALYGIRVTLSPIFNVSKLTHPTNARSASAQFVALKLTVVKLEQLSKEPCTMCVTFAGMVIEVKPVQFLKAYPPIVSIVLGKETDVIHVAPQKMQ